MIPRFWVAFVSRRWFDSRSRMAGSGASWLASIGIAAGVATLVVVLGVMNGFQSGYINALLEVSSFHARVTFTGGKAEGEDLATGLSTLPGVRSVLGFREARVLISARGGRVAPIKILVLPRDFATLDPGFASELGVDGSTLDKDGICLGSEAARQLAVEAGDVLSLYVPAISPTEGLSAIEERLPMSGSFSSGYYQFDSRMALVSEEALSMEGIPLAGSELVYGVKLRNEFADAAFIADAIRAQVIPPNARIESWRDYNRSFFGALRTEKVMMFILIGLVFIVVGVNIHHSMRRMVAMRNEDIAVLRALGAESAEVGSIFAMNGIVTGIRGAILGLLAGLFIAVNINGMMEASGYLSDALSLLVSRALPNLPPPSGARSVFYMQQVPVRLFLPEIIAIGLVAIGSAVLAALSASRDIARRRPSEILRYE